MEKAEYQVMYESEERHWWYLGLRDLILSSIESLGSQRLPLELLDVGCGTGKLLESCSNHRGYGLEYSAEAFRFLRRRGIRAVVRATACRIPFPDDSFDVMVSADVICSIEVPGDLESLHEMARVLKPGGCLLLNLPAYDSLRSHHDAAVHIRQRYTRGLLRGMLEQVGLEVRTLTYRNTALFPVAASIRRIQRLIDPSPVCPKSDLGRLPRALNWALRLLLLVENRLIRAGATLPFGLSVFCIAVKPREQI